MHETFSAQWGGRTLTIEVGKYANQANGSCVVRYGDTVVLGTAVMSDQKREGIGFFPLVVDYEEKLYASGKIKSSRFMKREGRPSDDAILISRMIDRSMRPLFDDRIRNEVQVIATALSADLENDADIPAMVAASCALSISGIPWAGPIAGIRIGLVPPEEGEPTSPDRPGEWVINQTFAARQKSILDMVVCGTPEKVIMIEAEAREVPEKLMEEAIAFAQTHLSEVLKLIEEVKAKVGKPAINVLAPKTEKEKTKAAQKDAILNTAREFILPLIKEKYFGAPKATKEERRAARHELEAELAAHLEQNGAESELISAAVSAVYGIVEEDVSRAILEEGKRVDGRALDEVRPLTIEVGVLPRTHGSAHFSRGETQVLSIVTLGSPSLEQTIEGMEFSGKKHYMHHYNFPPFSVGEVKPLRGPGRRDIGHGALAEKALVPVLPPREEFPYTIRVVSEVLSSNGSSSMASACGSAIALMDAGVPIKRPVAGVAMGLASDKSGRYKILTDLQDLEDGKGGMDFKITGTAEGITAIQLDTKTDGLIFDIIRETFTRARSARIKVLEEMARVISEPRPELSPYAPRIYTIQINPEKIRDVIGPGGKVINEIIAKTGVEIDIEQTGLVFITSVSAEAADKAVEWVKNLTREVKAGEVFEGKITRIMDFGAFAEILPNQEGLIHISKLAPFRVERVTDIVKVGDIVPVIVSEIDEMGRINLSLKDAPGYSVEKYGGSGPQPPGSSGDFFSGPRGRGRPRSGPSRGGRPMRGGGQRRPRY